MLPFRIDPAATVLWCAPLGGPPTNLVTRPFVYPQDRSSGATTTSPDRQRASYDLDGKKAGVGAARRVCCARDQVEAR